MVSMAPAPAPLPPHDAAAPAGLRRFALIGGLVGLGALAAGALAAAPGAGGGRPVVAVAIPLGAAAMVDQTVPRTAERLLADAEYVNGPAASGFDPAAFLAGRPGALAGYRETVAGESLSAAQIIQRVADEHSISPRLLIALVEDATGAVDDASMAGRLAAPFGGGVSGGGLHAALRSAAAWLDDGFYGLKYRDTRTLHFADGSAAEGPTTPGAGHFAVARFLAMGETASRWPGRLASFAATFRRLFGDIPAALAGPPAPIPPQPPLLLPWAEGERWYFTGGPHGGWGVATAWSAVDFAPPSPVGCRAAPEWVLAAAPGVVTRSERGYVVVDLDGDGDERSGWVLLHLHMGTEGRVPSGTVLAAGDRIGHPSCEGGRSTGAHLHLARRYDGEWVPAFGGPAPLDLSGWTFAGSSREYDGSMARAGDDTRQAVTSGRGGRSDIVSDNGPTRRAELAVAWQGLAAARSQVASAAPMVPAAAAAADLAAAALDGTVGPESSPVAGPAEVPGEPPARSEAEAPWDLAGVPELVVNLRLPGRAAQHTPFEVRIEGEPGHLGRVSQPAGEALPFVGHTDAAGRGEPIVLTGLAAGPYRVTVRVPGFRPQQLFDVTLGPGRTTIDLTSPLTPLLAGELTQDDAIDGRDLAAWLGLAAERAPAADVDGDGRVGVGDLGRILDSWRHAAP
jgi:hypothetical protein